MDMIAITFDIAMFLSSSGDCVHGDRTDTTTQYYGIDIATHWRRGHREGFLVERPSPLCYSSIRSLPTMTRPPKCLRAASLHIASVTDGSSLGMRCESTSAPTCASAAMRPASSAVVWC